MVRRKAKRGLGGSPGPVQYPPRRLRFGRRQHTLSSSKRAGSDTRLEARRDARLSSRRRRPRLPNPIQFASSRYFRGPEVRALSEIQKTHRYLIRDAANEAVKRIGKDAEIEDSPRLDHDTQDVSGTREIAGTIYRRSRTAASSLRISNVCRVD